MTTDPREDKLREFFASGADDIDIETLELRNPAFVDEDDAPAAVRFVNDPTDKDGFKATLEGDAPLNAGEQVTFACGAFDLQLPEQTTEGLPSAQLSTDNVTRKLMPYLMLAASPPSPIDTTIRIYVESDTSAPAAIYSGLSAKAANAAEKRVTAQIGFDNFLAKPTLTATYNRTDYPGLDR